MPDRAFGYRRCQRRPVNPDTKHCSALVRRVADELAAAGLKLKWFGVDAALQGRGLGGQLMKACLGVVDASHLPAYLETPNPRNISFYERHGFEVTGEAQAGACPPVVFMLRTSR